MADKKKNNNNLKNILGRPGGKFTTERAWALTLEPVQKAFEFPDFDWPDKYFLSNQRGAPTESKDFLHEVVFDHRSP